MNNDDPVNDVRLSRSGGALVVDECVICGGTHRHGSNDPAVARGDLSHRVAHCKPRDAGEDSPGGYYLKFADDAERREIWLDYVLPNDEYELGDGWESEA